MTAIARGGAARAGTLPRASAIHGAASFAVPRTRVALAALAAALLVGVLGPAIGVAPATPARAAAADLALVTDATYVVRPGAGRVSVSVAITARNRTAETRTRRFFFDHAFLAVQPGSTGFRVSGPKGARVRATRRTRDATTLRIDFGSRLWSGKAATFLLSFDLPGSGKGASPLVRVGTGLVTLPVWAFATSGARGSTVTVRVPPGWDVTVESGSFSRRAKGADGWTVLTSGAIANPLSFFAYVSAQRPAVYAESPVTLGIGDQQVDFILRAWEDDPGWTTRTGSVFASALPVLRKDIGLDWPRTAPLVIQEAASRDPDGYAAQFDPAEGRIDVAYWADGPVTIHEAAHGWFNADLLADRWADEAFASFYALRAARTLKLKANAPALTPALRKVALPLNAWTGGDGSGSATDAYGRAASLALATAIADRVGTGTLGRVWTAAAGRVGAYQPVHGGAGSTTDPSAPEGVDAAPDWRGLLDLLEEASGKDLGDLWRTWVLRSGEVSLLDARAAARTSYRRTLALAGDWELPRAIRDALRAWQFDEAERLMADTRTVLAQRNAVVAMADRDGVDLPDAMRAPFEAGTLPAASAHAEAERNALVAIEEAAAVRTSDDDLLSRIGMLGAQPDADLAAARSALEAGDIDATVAAADRAYRGWSGAWQEGRRRALLSLAALAIVIVLVSAVAASARRARRAGTRAVRT